MLAEKVEIYSKEGCMFCVQAKMIFEIAKFPIIEYKLDTDYTKEQFIEKFGNSTFPRILINDKLIGGFSELSNLILEKKIEINIPPKTI